LNTLKPKGGLVKETEVKLDGNEIKQTLKVAGEDLLKTVKEVVKEVGVRRIIIKNDEGETCLEVPVAVAGVTTLLLPVVVAVSAIAALCANYTIEVVKVVPEEKPAETPPEAPKA
jgi:hypothetical protein